MPLVSLVDRAEQRSPIWDSHLHERVQFNGLRTGISFTVSAEDRTRLEAVIFHPSSPQKHVWRCRIVLLSADGLGTTAIMASTAKSKTCVWRWQDTSRPRFGSMNARM